MAESVQIDGKEKKSKARLKFIDMGRSFAILLMLEGHFTGAALGTQYRDDTNWIFSFWHQLHGFTSPLFFTVTGLVFVYLLSAHSTEPYFSIIRVRKGYKRVLELLFWGYLIQLNLWSIGKSIYYGSDFHMEWFYAFHVLQSIGVGILFLLLIFGIYKLLNFGKLHWYYLIAAILVYTFYSWMKAYINLDKDLVEAGVRSNPHYLPQGLPRIIQNMFYGPFSDFSFVRYAGYTILGGMLGSFVRTYEHHTKKLWFGVLFILAGLVLSLFAQPMFHSIDNLTENIGLTAKGVFELNSTSIIRFGQVVSFIGLLMLIDKYFTVKNGLFLKIGQNTLPIYVVHVIILYGGLFGFGLTPYLFERNLSPWTAIAISAAAIFVFALMIKYIEPLEKLYRSTLGVLKFRKNSRRWPG